MRTIPTTPLNVIQSRTPTLVLCVKIERADGEVIGVTNHDQDLTFGGVTYEAADGGDIMASEHHLGVSIDEGEVSGFIQSERITTEDLRLRKYDGAQVTMLVVSFLNPTAGSFELHKGFLGSVIQRDGQWIARLHSLLKRGEQPVIKSTSSSCRNEFCDSRCGLDVEDFITSATVETTGVSVAGSDEVSVYKINCGGSSSGGFAADSHYSGGDSSSSGHAIDLTGVVDPAPEAVYQTKRVVDDNASNIGQSFSYVLTGLDALAGYLVRLHFAETSPSVDGPGKRAFDVFLNGFATSLINFDIYAETGGQYIGLVRELDVQATAAGEITIKFQTVRLNAAISGIEITKSAVPAIEDDGIRLSSVADATGLYNQGRLKFTSGANAGLTLPIKYHTLDAGDAVILPALPVPFMVEAGDNADLIRGCGKTPVTCQGFSNFANFNGEPYLPGNDRVLPVLGG